MAFNVSIETFEGPLDLMLHLIKEKQLDIFNLDIDILADQYIDFIHQMEKMKLDIASEYLVELATLIEYKSKKLLPSDNSEVEDNYQEEKENDLVKRLIEYKKYKEVSQQFESLYKERELLHDKVASDLKDYADQSQEDYASTSIYELIKAMDKVLKRYKLAKPYEVSITTQRISVEERENQLKETIKRKYNKKTFTLKNALLDCKDTYDVVVTFLSLLNLIHDNYIKFEIKDDEIYFARGIGDE